MPPLKNPKHELFAQAMAKGMTQVQAYRAAGYTSNGNPDTCANVIFKKQTVRDRIDEITARGAARAEVTVASLIEEAEEARQLAMATDNPSAAVQAIREKGVLSGKRVQRTEIGAPGEFDHLSDEELFALFQEGAAEIGIQISGGRLIDGGDTEH